MEPEIFRLPPTPDSDDSIFFWGPIGCRPFAGKLCLQPPGPARLETRRASWCGQSEGVHLHAIAAFMYSCPGVHPGVRNFHMTFNWPTTFFFGFQNRPPVFSLKSTGNGACVLPLTYKQILTVEIPLDCRFGARRCTHIRYL